MVAEQGGGVTFYKSPLLAGMLVALMGVAVLMGWGTDNTLLTSIVIGQVTTKANAALGLLLCGLALVLASHEPVGRPVKILIKAVAFFVMAGAAATVSQDLFGWNLGIDQWLLEDRNATLHSAAPGRMSPTAAYCFLLVGTAFWVAHWRFGVRYQGPIVIALTATVIVAAALAFTGNVTTGPLHSLLWNYSGVALHSSLGFLLLGFGLIAIVRRRQRLVWSLSLLTSLGFAAGTVILLVTTLFSSHSITRAQEDMSALAQSHQILTEIEEIESNLARMENDQRAFLLDGSASHLDDQQKFIKPIWAYIASLRRLTAPDPYHRERLDRIGPLLADRLHRADRSIATLERDGQVAAMVAFTADLAAGQTAEIERLREEMEEHEHAVLASLESRAQVRYTAAFLQLPLGLLLSLTILAFGLVLLDERTREQQRNERTVRASEGRLRLFVDRAPAAIAMVDMQMRYLAVSRRWLTDYRLGDRDITGLSHYEVFPEIPERWREIHRRCLTGAVEKCEKDRFPRADGVVDWIKWEVRPWHRDNGEIGGIVLFSEVITESVDATDRIRRLNRVYAVLSGINSVIVRVHGHQQLFDEACRIAVREGLFASAWIGVVDRAAMRITAVASAGIGSAPKSLPLGTALSPNGQPVVINDIRADARALRDRPYVDDSAHSLGAFPLVASGEVVGILELHAAEAGAFDSEELKLLGELAGDIGYALQAIKRQEKLDFLSYYDTLTGLPNRALFIDRATQWLGSSDEQSRALALIVLNIDRFANVNETLGRHGGDELLKQVAQRLEAAFDGKDSLVRLGADGFGVMLRGVADTPAVARAIEEKVLGSFREVFRVQGQDLHVSAKSGVAIFPGDGPDADTLFRNAEAALKNARSTDTDYLFYSAAMNARAAQALSLETRLRKASESEQFILYYQPKYNLEDMSISGLEALIRWKSPEGTIIPPAVFISVLEQTGLIIDVGRWVMKQALVQHRKWTERGLRVPRIAVNVSAVQLQRRDFADVVMGVLQEEGDNAVALELEITESLIMKDVENSRRKFSILRGLGVHIAMDDFGTGYSSLAVLARLPINTLKIDRSFIVGLTENPQDFGIVTTVIGLAHTLDLRVVAEGVETQEQATLLKLLKCDEAQGYLFSRPVPAAEIDAMLLPAVAEADAEPET